EYTGTVTYISKVGTIEAGVVSYETTITIDEPGPELKDAMSATAEIVVEAHEDVLMVPRQAIVRTDAGKRAVELWTGEEVRRQPVTTGVSTGRYTEIVKGLSEGDVVILNP
ncbi:MAG: efflux RND transporter periplasmic adaptor subunit, partial [Chloroflexota bacterium]